MATLIDTFGKQKRWVNWSYQTVKGKITKVPNGDANHPETWHTYEELQNKKDIGLMFGLQKRLLGIDIDKCIDPIDGAIEHERKNEILALLEKANTYCEVSPSGAGLHLFLLLSEPMDVKDTGNKQAPFELYTHSRYFTVTNNPFGHHGEKPVRKVTPEEAMQILETIQYPWKKKADDNYAPVRHEIGMEDNEILSIMFKVKNGVKIKALYDGETGAYGDDKSNADMAFCSHLAFYTQGDQEQMKRIWLASPLGSRAKTQERKDYVDMTVSNAVANTKEFYKPKNAKKDTIIIMLDDQEQEVDLDLLFTLDKDGNRKYTMNTENIARVLRKHPQFKDRLRFDIFKNRMEIMIGSIWKEIEDNDQVLMQTEISISLVFFQRVTKPMVADAMLLVCKEHQIDSAAEYVRSIPWDQEGRLDKWLYHVYGTPNDAYHQTVGSNWIKGLVNRIINPGCKFDYVLVLEGAQGSKKSSSLAALGASWHFETSEGMENKDFFQQFEGKAIVEFSEGETLSRTEVKRMKAIITTQIDRYRPSYGRFSMDFPRRCVFAMTTNADEYLKDETGNRRWLPVKVYKNEADVDWVIKNRAQMFAEAYHRLVNLREKTWEFPKDEMLDAQDKRRIHDPNAEVVEEWYGGLTLDEKQKGITVHQVHKNALGGTFQKMNRSDEMSIASILKNHMKMGKIQNSINGIRAVRWYEPSFIPGNFVGQQEEQQKVDQDKPWLLDGSDEYSYKLKHNGVEKAKSLDDF